MFIRPPLDLIKYWISTERGLRDKEYSIKQYIGIYVYRDHLSFINHNRPVPPVTIEDLNTKVVFDDRHYLNDELKEMFFKLDLIQSYGSGVRRAKKAMEDNKSPELVYI